MAYTPTEWKTGDVVTAEKLNKLEDGVASASLLCFVVIDSETGDRTLDAHGYNFEQVKNIVEAHGVVIALYPFDADPAFFANGISEQNGEEVITFVHNSGATYYVDQNMMMWDLAPAP